MIFIPYVPYDTTLHNLMVFQHTHKHCSVYTPLKIDQERMQKAINANRTRLPQGLSKAGIHDFLLNRAEQIA